MAEKKEEPALNKAAVEKITGLLESMDKHLYGMVLRLSTIAENISNVALNDKLKSAGGKDEEKEKEKTGFAKALAKLDEITSKFDKFAKSVISGTKSLLGWSALALLFFDPQTLFSILSKTVMFVADMVDAIGKFMDGDIKGGFQLLGDNLGGVAIALGAITLLFGGKILRTVRGLIKTAEFLFKGMVMVVDGISATASFIGKGVGPTINFLRASFGFLGQGLMRIVSYIPTIIETVGKVIDPAIDFIRWGFGLVGEALGFAGRSIGVLGEVAPALGKGLMSLVGKLALPITIIMGIVGAVEGAIAGFQEDGIIGGIKGAIVGLFDGIIGGLLDMIKDAVSWVAGMFGFENVSATLDSFSFTGLFSNLVDAVFSPIEKTIDWVKTLFSDPMAALQQLWDGIASGGLIDIMFYPINKAIQWVSGIFGWKAGEDFSFGSLVTGAFWGAWNWVSGIFTLPDFSQLMSFGSLVTDAFWSAWNWVSGIFKLPDFSGLMSFGSLVTGAFWSAWDWISGLFTLPDFSKLIGDRSIGSIVTDAFWGAWNWVSGLFTLPDFSKLIGDRSIGQVFDDTWNGIINWFSSAFDFLPSLDDITSTLTSLLPEWMQPASIEEQRNELSKQIADLQNSRNSAPARNDINAVQDVYTTTQEEIDAEIADLTRRLQDLPQMRNGGILDADKNGTLTMLHGREAVIPLDNPNAMDILTSPIETRRANYALGNISEVASSKERASITSLSAPTVVHNGGSTVTNITNVSNAGTSRYLRPQYEFG